MAGIAFRTWERDMYASAGRPRVEIILRRIKEEIDNGSFPAPDDPAAREAIKAKLDEIFIAAPFPPQRWGRSIEKELFPDRPENN